MYKNIVKNWDMISYQFFASKNFQESNQSGAISEIFEDVFYFGVCASLEMKCAHAGLEVCMVNLDIYTMLI